MATLLAGAGRAIINPPLGLRTMGFSSRVGFIDSIESDLTATCIVLAGGLTPPAPPRGRQEAASREAGGLTPPAPPRGQTKVAIIALDIALSPMSTVNELRQRVASAIGTHVSHVMLNYSHTHSAPAFPGWLPEAPEQHALLQAYEQRMMEGVVESALAANSALQPARIAAGWGHSDIGVQRREKRADGFVFLGEVPDGEIDRAVGVIRVDDLAGNPIAITCSYGCHTVVVGPRDLSASPDFPGATRATLEKLLGGHSLFLQACGGDIMPKGGMGYETDCHDAKNRTGMMLGGEAVRVAAGLRSHIQRGARTTLGAVSTITLWPWTAVTGESCSYLGAVSETLALDFMDYPPLAEAEQIRAEQQRRLREAYRSEDERQIAVGLRWADWADRLVAAIQTGRRTLDMTIQVIRINDIVLAGLSVESFAGTGMKIKSHSPFAHTQVLGYTNGCVCYLPPAEDFPPGGWDIRARYGVPDMIFQSYSLPAAIKPDSEGRVVERSLKLIQQLV
jgi:neutral ceramidase